MWHFSELSWCVEWYLIRFWIFFKNCLIFPGLTDFIAFLQCKKCNFWTWKNQSIFEENLKSDQISFNTSRESRQKPHTGFVEAMNAFRIFPRWLIYHSVSWNFSYFAIFQFRGISSTILKLLLQSATLDIGNK